jgi:hypothetical protein
LRAIFQEVSANPYSLPSVKIRCLIVDCHLSEEESVIKGRGLTLRQYREQTPW